MKTHIRCRHCQTVGEIAVFAKMYVIVELYKSKPKARLYTRYDTLSCDKVAKFRTRTLHLSSG